MSNQPSGQGPARPLARSVNRLVLFMIPLVLAAIAVHAAPPAARAQGEPSSLSVVREGYDSLLTIYVDPLRPADLVSEAWNGAAAAAIAAGVDAVPSFDTIPEDREGAWSAFAAAFSDLEAASEGLMTSQKLAYAALAAMATARNECHTDFLTPEAFARFQAQLSGTEQYGGLGIQIAPGGSFQIVNVFPGSPAEQAGIMPGDVILAVDGTTTSELTNTSLSSLVRGPEGTPVTLTLQRGANTAPFDVTAIRALIRIPVLTSTLRPDGIGVITLNVFANDGSSEQQLRDALRDLEEKGAKAWVLDLRLNGGGAVISLQSVLGAFLPGDVRAFSLQRRTGGPVNFTVSGEAARVQRPMAVLVGPGTGSAAEVAAAVLQDTSRARIFGQRTAACVNGALTREFSDGSGMLVTSARILAGPQRRVLDGNGVIPDEETPSGSPDAALRAAVAYLQTKIPAAAR